MTIRTDALAALAAVNAADPVAIVAAASQALDHDLSAQAAPMLAQASIRYPGDARIWQFLGLARRDLQDSAAAHEAFSRAAALAPNDPLIAHSQARTALEAGFPAIPLFNRARLLAPSDGSVALGRLAALAAEGDGAKACEQLSALLAQSQGWTEGHLAYAQLAAQYLPDTAPDATLRQALQTHPASGGLWRLVFAVGTQARNYVQTLDAVGEARLALGDDVELDRIEALCRSELGETGAAQTLFDRLPFPIDPEAAIWPIRNYMRAGAFDAALTLAEHDFDGADIMALWPYRALLWRIMKDPRWQWLEGDERLVGVYDIAAEISDFGGTVAAVRRLHVAKGQPLDQSVRGGTQTDGNVLARAEPEVRQLRAALLDAVHAYIGQLPSPNPDHPTLSARRDEVRLAGAWSVRLTRQGFHVDHVHWQGWISSAFYLAVPDQLDRQDGALILGACRDLLPNLEPFRVIKPEPGKLVLFPSTMWHGTRPFGTGERMTVAFDISRPRFD